jgi:hypothetical protein
VFIIGNTDKIRIPNNNAKTPPILFGVDLKIALKSRKYHSGAISQHNYFLTIHFYIHETLFITVSSDVLSNTYNKKTISFICFLIGTQ